MRLPSLLLIATALATAAYGAADIEYVPDDYSNVLVEVEARNPEPSSLTDLSASVRAGVTFPLTSSVVVPNVQYTATFQLAQTNNWTAVSLNLWLMQEKEYFVTQLRPQLPVQNIINAATLQGSIVFDVTAEVCGTGPIYFMKVEGVDGVGATYDLPNSQLFPIFDPSAGSWSSPAPSTTLHAGRTVTLSYKLSSQFNQVKTVRIELAAATMKQSFIILDNVPVTPNAQSNEIVWNVPIVFLTGSFYYFRVIPNDGPDSFSDNTEAGLPVTGFSLPSFGMNLQQNVPSIQNPFINVTAPNATVTTGRLYNITWTYSGSGTVSNWFVDLYTVGPASANYTSGRIANITDGSMSFRWNATRTTYWDGLYYLRVYGYMDGTPVAPDVDPISGVSGWFNVVNPGWEPVLSINAFTATPLVSGGSTNVTFKILKRGGNVTMNGFSIDLLQASAPQKFITQLNTVPISVLKTWMVVAIPPNIPPADDYYIRVRANLDQSSWGLHDVGVLSTQLSIGSYSSLPTPSPVVVSGVLTQPAATPYIASFPYDPWNPPKIALTGLAGAATATWYNDNYTQASGAAAVEWRGFGDAGLWCGWWLAVVGAIAGSLL